MKDTDILITGGYGTVGRRVAADLAPDYPGRLVVAGRSAQKAAQLAAELGHGMMGGAGQMMGGSMMGGGLFGMLFAGLFWLLLLALLVAALGLVEEPDHHR